MNAGIALAPVERHNPYARSLGFDASLVFVTLQFTINVKWFSWCGPINSKSPNPKNATLLLPRITGGSLPQATTKLLGTCGDTPRDVSSLIFQVNRVCNIYRHPQHIITTLESALIAQPQGIICRSSSYGVGVGEASFPSFSFDKFRSEMGTPLRLYK